MTVEEKLRHCYQCGVCTAACPVRKVKTFSPRGIIYDVISAGAPADERVWDCLVCNSCYDACPQGVDFPNWIVDCRREVKPKKGRELAAHKGVFSEITELMAYLDSGIRYDSLDLGGIKDDNSEYGYFPGCLPFFDLFMDVDVDFFEIANSSVRLLNAMGIKPRILELKCCGHDILYQGDEETFERLLQYNTEEITRSGIKKLVLSCAECFLTFKKYYKIEEMGIEIFHISQLLSDYLREDELDIDDGNIKGVITYHDPCALGKHMKIYEAPRSVIKHITEKGKDIRFVELLHSSERSQCCGVSGMMNCDDFAKALREEKLREVKASGADILVTTCPKCVAHLNCLKKDKKEEYDIEIMDLTAFLSGLLKK